MKISIITINFNNLEGLKKTMFSVFNQTWQDFEFIVIDGGSTDGSASFIKEHSNTLTYWVSEPDKGIYNAMNKGIVKAKGDYVLFLNSGDFLHNETTLELALNTFTSNEDIIYGDVLLQNTDLGIEKIQAHPSKLPFSYFYRQTICQQSSFIKRKLFDQIFYFNEEYKISSDWEFFVYAIYIEKVSYKKIDLIIAVYNMEGISSTIKFRNISNQERQQTLETYFPLFIDDYKLLMSYSSTRFTQLKRIENSVLLRKIVSVIFNCLLFFFPNQNK